MSGVLWEFLAFIYIKAHGLIVRDIMPSCLACLGRRVLVPEDILSRARSLQPPLLMLVEAFLSYCSGLVAPARASSGLA
jgi:hypothetical protein